MTEFDENKHPRNEDGRFTNGGAKEFRQNESYTAILKADRSAANTLTKKEFAIWYKKIGEIERGGCVAENLNGDKLIPIENKLAVTSGTYEAPELVAVVAFKSEDEMYFWLSNRGDYL